MIITSLIFYIYYIKEQAQYFNSYCFDYSQALRSYESGVLFICHTFQLFLLNLLFSFLVSHSRLQLLNFSLSQFLMLFRNFIFLKIINL